MKNPVSLLNIANFLFKGKCFVQFFLKKERPQYSGGNPGCGGLAAHM